ncbi:hypothetical protein F511_19111 [Dorcoceras hygrometricum]|uniref:Uncharacterized protein n=1 Tax=Dorcoceras hygrometricum TaxID=472368 RepID=A0A2Z7A903_9LAMI|nr:hypothetical protein F511_19111 [Dorcoceras hygrometricum]
MQSPVARRSRAPRRGGVCSSTEIQQMLFAMKKISSRWKNQSRATESSRKKADVAKHCNQAQSIQSTKISAEDEFSHSDKPAGKQLTIYEELSKLDIQQMLFAMNKISSRWENQSRATESSRKKADVAKHCNQAQSIQSTKISAEDEFSRSDKPAAKQLTIYEELSKLDVNC